MHQERQRAFDETALWFEIGRLVPPRHLVLVVGTNGERLAEGLGDSATHVGHDEATSIEPWRLLDAHSPDLVVLVGGIHGDDRIRPLIETAADQGIPVLYATPDRHSESDAGVAIRMRARFEVLSFCYPNEGCANLAIPNRTSSLPRWLPPYATKMRRRLEKLDAQQSSAAPFAGKIWDKRDEIVSSWIPPGLAIADIGCGSMTAEALLRPREYIPIDLERRDERTRVLDLNRFDIPLAWLQPADVVLLLGVLEYLVEPRKHIARIASLSKTMVVSYNVFERRSHLRQVLPYNWKSALSSSDLRHTLSAQRYRIELSSDVGRQCLFLAKPART